MNLELVAPEDRKALEAIIKYKLPALSLALAAKCLQDLEEHIKRQNTCIDNLENRAEAAVILLKRKTLKLSKLKVELSKLKAKSNK